MTNKEAIEFIKNMIDREAIGFVVPEGDGDVAIWQYHVEALEMAITALDQLDNNSTKPDNLALTQSNGIEAKVKGMTACRVPEDDYISRREAIRIASGYCHPANVAKELAKLPPVQPKPDENTRPEQGESAEFGVKTGETCADAISRQAAIDIERNATVDTNPSHFEAHQKFTQFMDDAEISSFGRWQWSNGFNTALMAVGIDLKKLPSAQPEIIRCKDCKWWGYDDETSAVRVCHAAKHGYMSSHWDISIYRTYRGDFYCADAERRTDEPD